MRSKITILLFALVSVIIVFNEDKQDHNQLSSDACGYYLYLPAVFIYHDLGKLSFYPTLDSEYNHSLGVQYSLHNVNGNKLDKYTAGVALMELPFFLAAHAYCHITNQYKPDGFTLPYQLAMILGNIFWAVAGLFVLRRFLKRHYADSVVAITLICIAFGTNLYAYSSFTVGMSHPYSFFLFACLLLLTDVWYAATPTWRTSLLLGTVCGLIFIVRPINIIALVIPGLWMVSSMAALSGRMRFFARNYRQLLVIIITAVAVACIQFAYWRYITGHWLFYSYRGEGFNFLHPYIMKGLFSYRKGWFVYTPMALVGLAGFYFLWKKDKKIALAPAVFMVLMTYVVFSWNAWWYGGSFGCRAMIESLAVLALPLAAMTEYFYNTAGKIKKALYYIPLLLIIALNIFQTYQYSMGLLHWSDMTKEYYWRLFGKTNFDRAENKKYLLKPSGEKEEDGD